jgi:hypothetical protein
MVSRMTLAAALAFGLAIVPVAAGAGGVQHFFVAPGRITSCELDLSMPGIGTSAYCQTYPHPESVVLNPTGRLAICRGAKCIGNPPDRVPTLAYGARLSAGPFSCTSTRAGVRCVVASSGLGFLISPSAITKLS